MNTPPSPLIIALGAGLINRTPADPPYLWIGSETELRAAAAAKIWQKKSSGTIIMSGGPQGPGTPSEAECMAEYVLRPPWSVHLANVLREDASIDTASNVRNVVALMKQLHLSFCCVTLVAGRTNLHRAAAYFRAYGICVKPKLAREVLGNDIGRYQLPDPSQGITLKARLTELLLRLEQLVDRKGRLITLIKEWQLTRQHRSSMS